MQWVTRHQSFSSAIRKFFRNIVASFRWHTLYGMVVYDKLSNRRENVFYFSIKVVFLMVWYIHRTQKSLAVSAFSVFTGMIKFILEKVCSDIFWFCDLRCFSSAFAGKKCADRGRILMCECAIKAFPWLFAHPHLGATIRDATGEWTTYYDFNVRFLLYWFAKYLRRDATEKIDMWQIALTPFFLLFCLFVYGSSIFTKSPKTKSRRFRKHPWKYAKTYFVSRHERKY